VHATVATSHASILVPFLLGTLLAVALYPRLSNRDVPFTSFALFMGVAMSITAFPVLARILTDRGMTQTELGVVALGCAAIDDVTAWCLLAFIVGIARAQVGAGLLVTAGALGYIAGMLLIARPLLRRVAARSATEPLPRGTAAGVFVALLLSALTAEGIGIHAIFGAFLLGAVIPHKSVIAQTLTRQLEHLVTVLLLPAFFAFTGMRTRIDLVSGLDQWLICALILLIATLGKFGGTLVAARLTRPGLARRRRPWDADEHAGAHGIDRAQYRAGPPGHLATALCHDGGDGAGDLHGNRSGAAVAAATEGFIPCNGEHPSDTRRAGVIRRQGRTAAGRRPIFRSPKMTETPPNGSWAFLVTRLHRRACLSSSGILYGQIRETAYRSALSQKRGVWNCYPACCLRHPCST
jgi:Sodium/hydrogen exchanger family